MNRASAVILLASLMAACSLPQDRAKSASDQRAWDEFRQEVTGIDPAERAARTGEGGLVIRTTDVASSSQVAKIRGSVRNTYAEPVYGIRYVVMILNSDIDAPQPLDTFQREVDTTVEPGEKVMMRLDVESMYFGQSGSTRIAILAFPVKLGDRVMPLPPMWRE